MKIPVQNLYFLLCYAWDHLEESDTLDVRELERFEHIHDLFGAVLAEGVFRLARRGIDRSYVERREPVVGIRGKLELAPTVAQALLVRGQTACCFEELSTDVPHNQVLLSTLSRLLRLERLDQSVRDRVVVARQRLPGVTEVPLSASTFARIQLDRNRRIYRFLLSVCRLLHECHLVDEVTGDTRFTGIDTERLVMWSLFEDFVTSFYRREQRRYRVGAQERIAWFALEATPGSERRVPKMRPDVLLLGPDRRIILDTKFYGKAMAERFGVSKLHSGHLYQIFSYVTNRQMADPTGPKHEGILLYPVVEKSFAFEFRTHGHRIQARSVDLGAPWKRVREELLGILEGGAGAT